MSDKKITPAAPQDTPPADYDRSPEDGPFDAFDAFDAQLGAECEAERRRPSIMTRCARYLRRLLGG